MIEWKDEQCVTIVMASGGYPGSYAKGKPITGLEEAGAMAGVTVFHAGTSMIDGQVVTAGGRVLGVTAAGETLQQAVNRAYAAVDAISFEAGWCRRDIAHRAL
jgi:phosphoribosylamine--glycine ligase